MNNATRASSSGGSGRIVVSSVSASPPTLTVVVQEVCPNDVIMGRGAPINGHQGNIRFRRIVANRWSEYVSTNQRQRKDVIARQIVTAVHNQKGRFLRKLPDPSTNNKASSSCPADVWVLVEERKVLLKVKQALRDWSAEEERVEQQQQQRRQQQPATKKRKRKHQNSSDSFSCQGAPTACVDARPAWTTASSLWQTAAPTTITPGAQYDSNNIPPWKNQLMRYHLLAAAPAMLVHARGDDDMRRAHQQLAALTMFGKRILTTERSARHYSLSSPNLLHPTTTPFVSSVAAAPSNNSVPSATLGSSCFSTIQPVEQLATVLLSLATTTRRRNQLAAAAASLMTAAAANNNPPQYLYRNNQNPYNNHGGGEAKQHSSWKEERQS